LAQSQPRGQLTRGLSTAIEFEIPFECWTVRFDTAESVEIGYAKYFVAIVLREATVSAAKENGCKVGTASDPAHSRRG
jgi:hypothetical protein